MHNQAATLTLLAILSLPSCVVPDPMYSANAAQITDTGYPPNKVVGTWATMIVSPVQTNTFELEVKTYYELIAGGGGRVRQVTFNRAVRDMKMAVEGPLQWHYEGKNSWRVVTPGTDKFRVTSNNTPWTMGYTAGRETIVRYYNGNLYEPAGGRVWVPADRSNVSSMAERQRSIPPALHITLPE